MLQTMEQSSGNALGYKLSGKITTADIGTFGPVAQSLIQSYGSMDLLLDITDLHWEKVSALSSDVKLVKGLSGKIDKLAMVADTKWSKELGKLVAPFDAKEFKTFDGANDAWDWVKG